MTLQEIFDQLAHGELVQISLGETDDEGELPEENKIKLISHIQLGLTQLYKRFRLKEGEVTINLQEDTNLYHLHSDFLESNADSEEPVKYLDDGAHIFDDRLIKIEKVLDDDGNELDLNKNGAACTLRTPVYNRLHVPDEVESQTIKVVYRQNHPKIDSILGPAVSFAVEMELPETHLEPLLYFVAARIMNPVGMVSEFHDGNNYSAKYEQACQMLEGHGHQIDNVGETTRFEQNGWV